MESAQAAVAVADGWVRGGLTETDRGEVSIQATERDQKIEMDQESDKPCLYLNCFLLLAFTLCAI